MQAFDFDGAIAMHRAWKMRFHLALDNIRDKNFDTRTIGDDDECRLGKWLAANATELGKYQAAVELTADHREFHRQAESIAEAIRSERIVQLDDTAIVEFAALSEKIEKLLLALKGDVAQRA